MVRGPTGLQPGSCGFRNGSFASLPRWWHPLRYFDRCSPRSNLSRWTYGATRSPIRCRRPRGPEGASSPPSAVSIRKSSLSVEAIAGLARLPACGAIFFSPGYIAINAPAAANQHFEESSSRLLRAPRGDGIAGIPKTIGLSGRLTAARRRRPALKSRASTGRPRLQFANQTNFFAPVSTGRRAVDCRSAATCRGWQLRMSRFAFVGLCGKLLVVPQRGYPLLLPRRGRRRPHAARPPHSFSRLGYFAGSGFVSVATALLTKRSPAGLDVSSTTAAMGLPG